MPSWADDITADLLKEIAKADTLPSANAAYLVYAGTFAKVETMCHVLPVCCQLTLHAIDDCTQIQCAARLDEQPTAADKTRRKMCHGWLACASVVPIRLG